MSTPGAATGMGGHDQAVFEEITRLELARAEAYLRRDIITLKRLLPEHFTFNRAVGSFGKDELLDLLESGRLTFESLDRRVEQVKVYHDTAVVLGKDEVKAWFEGKDVGGRYRFSNTYVREGGRWEVIVTHSSRIP